MVSQLIATVSSLSSYFAGLLIFHAYPLYYINLDLQCRQRNTLISLWDWSHNVNCLYKEKESRQKLKLSPFRVGFMFFWVAAVPTDRQTCRSPSLFCFHWQQLRNNSLLHRALTPHTHARHPPPTPEPSSVSRITPLDYSHYYPQELAKKVFHVRDCKQGRGWVSRVVFVSRRNDWQF